MEQFTNPRDTFISTVTTQHAVATFVTGSNGFLGHAVCRHLDAGAFRWVAATRDGRDVLGRPSVAVGDIGPDTQWGSALQGCGVVIHLAARVHVMSEQAINPLAAFRQINVQGSVALARQAAKSGVRRFVYVSSVKVNGERTTEGQRFRASDVPAPQDAYAISKLEAELALTTIARESGMELVIVRPPLVYGPGVKANFAAMLAWVTRGWPLPLASIQANRRSLVGVDNLADLLLRCASSPAAAGQIFLASDGQDLSTADLIRRIGMVVGRPARLVAVPEMWLRAGARLLGRPGIAQRLCDSLQLDIEPTCDLLQWKPPFTVDEGLHRTVMGFEAP